MMLTLAGCASEAVAVPTSHRLKRRSILTMLLTPGSLSLPLAATRVSSRRSTSLRRLKPFCGWVCLQASKLNSEQPLKPGDLVYEIGRSLLAIHVISTQANGAYHLGRTV